MTKTRCVHVHQHFRKLVQQLKKTLRFSASDKSRGVTEPLSLDDLPEECISIIISFTSPRDAYVFASVSKTFASAVQSDIIWENFLPSEYKSLIPQSPDFLSKKELYFALCHESVLIDDGKKILWVERENAKRCIMLSAMNLSITWGDSPQSWRWVSDPQARFETVAELLEVCLFEIRGRINTRVLSPRTRYSVYIVFMKVNICYGFENVAVEVVVGVVGKDLEESCRRYVCFDEARDEQFRRRDRGKNLVKPERRNDGWMEINLGEFFNEGGLSKYDEIEVVALENKLRHWKRGLIIRGVEIRPAKVW
ncbi:PREDICTED: putative F-box protein PP2-B8 [Camelina sativa]|uniref:F-box protein PP2-B8 n=1 Tax=Camelina sativa TaxID=90675 RepID=A0ABM0YK60_CAMSA|nr:PREDICTED: putative F-box protein PP2-B8 [Camelina sativa]